MASDREVLCTASRSGGGRAFAARHRHSLPLPPRQTPGDHRQFHSQPGPGQGHDPRPGQLTGGDLCGVALQDEKKEKHDSLYHGLTNLGVPGGPDRHGDGHLHL